MKITKYMLGLSDVEDKFLVIYILNQNIIITYLEINNQNSFQYCLRQGAQSGLARSERLPQTRKSPPSSLVVARSHLVTVV